MDSENKLRLTSDTIGILKRAKSDFLASQCREDVSLLFVLRTIARWDRKVSNMALVQCGAELHLLDSAIEELLGRAPRDRVGMTNVFEAIALNAKAASERMGVDFVASEHLVLAILNSGDESARLLVERNVTSDNYSATIHEMYGS